MCIDKNSLLFEAGSRWSLKAFTESNFQNSHVLYIYIYFYIGSHIWSGFRFTPPSCSMDSLTTHLLCGDLLDLKMRKVMYLSPVASVE